MFFVASWAIVLVLLGLWSTFMWLATAVVAWSLQAAGGLQAGGLAIPEPVRAWLPAEAQEALVAMASSLVGLFDWVLSAFPALASAVTVIGWLVWGLGTVLLIVLGMAVHGGLWFWRRRQQQRLTHRFAH